MGGKIQFGEVVKAEARPATKCFSQKERVGYLQIFSPSPASKIIRLVVCSALDNDLDFFHFDAGQLCPV